MLELIRTNDPVLLSFAQSLLKDAGIAHFLADAHMSVLDGSIGVLPRRLLVDRNEIDRARRLLRDAELGHELADGR
ncbi:DUF2007 domain-containing protein [Aureimonas jatrophae]|uniref:Putative signal transducing protein n=1 Tax=Aureimonas jatrophae TaxID=1166073 RepID=A0A1H0GLH5_9HYPH|nr:DUF2007 domain-containing protein [Aureimonas jatrophae]MBB3949635.1 hypothetical protein [Aureimonas jatrophae]SDO07765.1 Putative signal transducing protein [Aureimonas jatrophae]